MKHIFFFDLDGTLTDSGEGILNCVRHALDLQNWPYPSDENLRRFIGPPLIDSFMDIAGMNKQSRLSAIIAHGIPPAVCLKTASMTAFRTY